MPNCNKLNIITNFMRHDLAIIIVQNILFIGLYGINTNVIHLLVLFELQCHVHYLDTNVICLFVLFRHEYCVFICIIYTQKSCTQLPCLNNAWNLCVNNMNPWNNIFWMDLEKTHETYKFVMKLILLPFYITLIMKLNKNYVAPYGSNQLLILHMCVSRTWIKLANNKTKFCNNAFLQPIMLHQRI